MVGCGLACPGGGGAGVSGCDFFRGSGWGWDRARIRGLGVLGPGGGGSLGDLYHQGGRGGSNTEHGTIYRGWTSGQAEQSEGPEALSRQAVALVKPNLSRRRDSVTCDIVTTR